MFKRKKKSDIEGDNIIVSGGKVYIYRDSIKNYLCDPRVVMKDNGIFISDDPNWEGSTDVNGKMYEDVIDLR